MRENQLSDPTRVTVADYEWHVVHAPIFVWDASVVAGFSAGDPRAEQFYLRNGWQAIDVTEIGEVVFEKATRTNEVTSLGP